MTRHTSVVLATVLASVACDQQPVSESADMRRPAGMVYIERGDSRADVLIVDSEAQGVRVRQFARDEAGPRVPMFLPAPVVFFPLVIPAPGFPTRASASNDGDRAFVVAPSQVDLVVDSDAMSNSLLHVLDVEPVDYGGRISDENNIHLGAVDLTMVAPGALIPVDVVTLVSADGVDRVAVAFDAVGSGMGRVVVIDIPVQSTPTDMPMSFTEVVAIDVPGAVRRLVSRGDKLYVSNALTNVVTEIELSGATNAIDVGGPTGDLVDAADLGLLAMRIDRSSVVVMTGDPLARSTSFFESPFADIGDRPGAMNPDPDILGRIDLHDSAIGPAAYGVVPSLPLGSDTPLVPADGGPAVMIVHADGFATFLNQGSGGVQLAVTSTAAVTSVWKRDGPPGLTIAECNGLQVSGDEPDVELDCSATIANAFRTTERYRVGFRTPLVRERLATLELTTTSTLVEFLADIDFTGRRVMRGDRVLIHSADIDCVDPETNEFNLVEAISEATVVALHDRGLTLAPEGPLAEVDFCGADAVELAVALYEVYPGNDDGVMTRVVSGRIGEVIERAPASADLQSVVFGQADVVGPLVFTLTASAALSCTTARSSASRGAPCAGAAECALGWVCQDNDLAEDDGVAVDRLGRCVLSTCPEGAQCLTDTSVRACPALELDVAGTIEAALDLRIVTTDNTASVPSSAPDDAIWAPLNRMFLVSFPGARSIVEVTLGAADIDRRQVR